MKIVYAGLLGVAQNILSIIEQVDFKNIGVELHLYGDGNQRQKIESYIASNETNVAYHGTLSKNEIQQELTKYQGALVPLAANIKGAVPSKIFELMALGIPVLLCGSGEAADIINRYHVGWVSAPLDYTTLANNILRLRDLSVQQRNVLSTNGIKASSIYFDFNTQIDECDKFIAKIIKNK